MSQTIYARVPDQVKAATDAYASSAGMTLANAVAELLDRGLQAAHDFKSVDELERRVALMSGELNALRRREQTMASAYEALAQRTSQPVGTCPGCHGVISGRDLLVFGRCPNTECGASLTPLLDTLSDRTSSKGALNDGDFKLLLGALGFALGIALISQAGGG
jgi:hypothetical protein